MLFVYGTLQDPDVLAAILGRAVDVTRLPQLLAPGYRAVTYPGRVYPALVRAPGHDAPGLGLDTLSTLDHAALDAFEGDEYRRGSLHVVHDGQLLEADAYFPVAVIAVDGPSWSLDDWTRRHKRAVIGTEVETASALRNRLSDARSD